MALTQLESIRRQTEAAARNQMNRAAADLRRETSLVNRAHLLAGRAARGVSLPSGGNTEPRSRTLSGTVPTTPPPVQPAADGWVRRSPVQPLYRPANYYRRLATRITQVVLLVIAIFVVVYLLLRIGVIRV